MFLTYTVGLFWCLYEFFTTSTCGWYYWAVLALNDVYNNYFLNTFVFSFFVPLFSLFSGFYLQNYLVMPLAAIQLVPNSLIVGLYNIHPFFLYTSIILFFVSAILRFNLVFTNHVMLWLCSLFALILGGFWGLGNGVWGYFWVNDLIEQLLLFLCLIFCYKFHTQSSSRNLLLNFLLVNSVCISLIIIRNGLLSTRHAFFDATNLTSIIGGNFMAYNNLLCGSILIVLIAVIFKFFLYFTFKPIINTAVFEGSQFYYIAIHILLFTLIINWSKFAEFNISWRGDKYNFIWENITFIFNSQISPFSLNFNDSNLSIILFNISNLLSFKIINGTLVFTRYLIIYYIIFFLLY